MCSARTARLNFTMAAGALRRCAIACGTILLASSVLMLVASCACNDGCRPFQDNATSLGYHIESAVKRLETEMENAERVVSYAPVASKTKSYIVLFIPEGRLSEDDLVRKRVPGSAAHKLLRDLDYVGIREGGFIVVLQEGQPSFTRHGLHLVKIKELLAYETQGETGIVLKREKGEIWITGFK